MVPDGRVRDLPTHRGRAEQIKASRDLEEIVWPTIKHFAGGGEIVSLEKIEDDWFRSLMDITAGIDAVQHIDGKPSRGIASRVQWPGKRRYDTFTARRSRSSGWETETAKRIAAVTDREAGWLYPAITIQAYVDEREPRSLISAAMVSTVDLYAYLQGQSTEVDTTRFTRLEWAERKFKERISAQDAVWINSVDDESGQRAWFYAIDWHWMRKAGVPVRIWTPDGELGGNDRGWRY
jgi:hypothetical protein